MLSGILNVSLGHGCDTVSEALEEVQRCGLVNSYDRQSENADALRAMLGEYEPRFTWKLLNTGAEAIERAIQVACCAFQRPVRVAVLEDSFHGKTITMSNIRYDVPWGNPINVVTIDPAADVPEFDVLIYEPIRGWDGAVANEWQLRKLCDERRALLVADEMITGFMRCGERFMNNNADMVVSGKGLAQGTPLAVLGMTPDLVPRKFSIGWNTTGGGNNLSATIGLRVLEFLTEHEQALDAAVCSIEMSLKAMGFKSWGALGFKRMQADPKRMNAVFEKRRIIASWHDPFLRVGPSFITTEEELDQLARVLKEAEQ
jgi:4-aminobutyrate aminotransferase-like enzyme